MGYTICPVTSDVRRIRLELTTFDIEGPFTPALDGAAGATAGTVATTDANTAIGQCRGDQFVAATGLGSSPIICGFNTGQHMILDTDGTMCVTAIFTFSTSGNVQRSYRIHNVQFGGNNDMGGPTGCLQYYTGEMGTVNSFNWNGIATSVHLANHNYNVCIRRRVDACRICWSPIQTGAADRGNQATPARGAFGVSNVGVSDTDASSGVGTDCVAAFVDAMRATSGDFVEILGGNAPGADMGAQLVNADIAAGEEGNDVFCGRFFSRTAAMADASVCSRATPF